jgi:hypothetical protein
LLVRDAARNKTPETGEGLEVQVHVHAEGEDGAA